MEVTDRTGSRGTHRHSNRLPALPRQRLRKSDLSLSKLRRFSLTATKLFVKMRRIERFLEGVYGVSKRSIPRPTDAELAILRVLWQEGAATVRQVRDMQERTQPTGYTTVLKLLQIMTEKGLVTRDESRRTHVYRASRSEEQTQRHLVGDLAARLRRIGVEAGDAGTGDRKATAEELAEIRKLIETLEQEQEGGDCDPLGIELGQELVERLGWCLVHSVWQLAAVGLWRRSSSAGCAEAPPGPLSRRLRGTGRDDGSSRVDVRQRFRFPATPDRRSS